MDRAQTDTPSLAVPASGDARGGMPERISDAVSERTADSRTARVSELWTNRKFLGELASRDMKSRYKQSALGPIWLVIQPLGLLLAFTVVFAGLLDIETGGISYVLFAASGLTIWVFFQSALNFGSSALVANLSLVKLVPLPRALLPTAGLISALPVLILPLVLTLALSIILGDPPTARVFLVPIGLAWALIFTWGLVILLSAVIVHLRDVLYALPFFLQAGIFLSPVAYPAGRVENELVDLVFTLNPLTGIIEFWRWLVLPIPAPELSLILSGLAWTAVVAIGGWWTFRRLDPTTADVI